MTKKDFNNEIGLLYLIEGSGGVHSRIRLQKLVCLTQFTQKEISPFSFDYKSYYYGPYSEALREKVEDLIQRELIEEKVFYHGDESEDAETFSYSYRLTEKGRELLRKNLCKMKEKVKAVNNILERYGHSPNRVIIKDAKAIFGMDDKEKK